VAETGTLEDRPPVGNAVHRILDWEEQAILDLIEDWGPVDRSHRKLAHRGSYTGTVFVSPSTLLRVALKHRVELPGEPFRPWRLAHPLLGQSRARLYEPALRPHTYKGPDRLPALLEALWLCARRPP
jgi:hypothetical protein